MVIYILFNFSFKATAFYRMLNEIKLNANFYDEEAEKLKSCFSPGVIELVEDSQKDGMV